MSVFAVWIDRNQAKLFEFSHEKMERTSVRACPAGQQTQFDEFRDHQQQRTFFGEVARLIGGASRLLLLGPGAATLRSYLLTQAPQLEKRIVGCECLDHPSDGQIAAVARKLFIPNSR